VFLALFKNFLSLVGAEAFTKLITFAAFAYLARILGAANFGFIEWSAAVLMCASLIVDQGFSSYGAREIARNPSATARLTAEVVTARFLMAAIGYLAITLFAFGVVTDPSIRLLLLVYGLSLWALPLLLQWVFQGHDRMNLVAVTNIVRQTIFVGIVFAFVKGAENLLLVGVAEVVAVAVAALFSVWLYARYLSTGGEFPRPRISARLFREGAPIGLSQMFWTVKMFGATLILGLVATAEDTGYFAGAMRILIALHTFVWLYHFNLLPSLSRAWINGKPQFSKIIANSMRIVVPVGIAVGILWVWLAPFVMRAAYGGEFIKGGGALQWMAGACVAAAISGHYRFGLIAAGFQTREMYVSAVSAVVAALLIPVGYYQAGTSGAAAALCFAEIVALIYSRQIAKRTLFKTDAADSGEKDIYFENLPEATR